MVRTPALPSPFAGIDAKRIAGNTLVVALHAVAFALLMMPGTWDPPAQAPREAVVIPVYEPPKTPPKPTEPPPELTRVRPAPARTQPPARIEPVPSDPAPLAETGTEPALPEGDAGPEAASFDPGPQVATLAYAEAPPPRYPRPAIQRRLEGVVTLRVLVDAEGRPQAVDVERSSGHRVLDQAAREQVLARWRFHPAMRDGRAVPAYALVPVAFRLP